MGKGAGSEVSPRRVFVPLLSLPPAAAAAPLPPPPAPSQHPQEVSLLVCCCEGHVSSFGSIKWDSLAKLQFKGRSKMKLQQMWGWYKKLVRHKGRGGTWVGGGRQGLCCRLCECRSSHLLGGGVGGWGDAEGRLCCCFCACRRQEQSPCECEGRGEKCVCVCGGGGGDCNYKKLVGGALCSSCPLCACRSKSSDVVRWWLPRGGCIMTE